jgi:hypothetical protein
MMQSVPSRRSLSLCSTFLALALCLALVSGAHQRAEAQSRIADATAPVAVGYHLRITYIAGAHAGQTIEGGVAGMLDGAGTVTATLTVASGMTSTVTGSLGAATGASLSLAGRAGTLSLAGKRLGKASAYGGLVTLSDGSPAGAWLLMPELSTTSLEFAGVIHSGRKAGTTISGTLTIMADRAGHFDGLVALDDGTTAVAEGLLAYGNMQITLFLPGGGVLAGSAPRSLTIVNNAFTPSYSGSFAGPGTGDRGTWTAITSS